METSLLALQAKIIVRLLLPCTWSSLHEKQRLESSTSFPQDIHHTGDTFPASSESRIIFVWHDSRLFHLVISLAQGLVIVVSVVETIDHLATVIASLLFLLKSRYQVASACKVDTYIVIFLTEEPAHENVICSIKNYPAFYTLHALAVVELSIAFNAIFHDWLLTNWTILLIQLKLKS